MIQEQIHNLFLFLPDLMDPDDSKLTEIDDGDILSPDKLSQDGGSGLMAPPSTPGGGGRGGAPSRKPRLRVGFGIGGFIARPRARGSLLRRMGMGRGAMGDYAGPIGQFGGEGVYLYACFPSIH